MDLSILLAKVFGLYLIIGGVISIYRRGYFIPVFGRFVEKRVLRLVLGFIELVAALFLVTAHQVWSSLYTVIISIFGWLMIVESLFYLTLSDKSFSNIVRLFNKPGWYLWGGLVAIVLGVYLTGVGFSIF